MNTRTITPTPVRDGVHVKAGIAKAFDVFTAGMNRWWAKSHKIGPTDLKEVIIEPRAGGR